MLISTLIPISRNKKKSINSSENYRAIALGSIIGKVLDLIITKQNHTFKTYDYQFGFKQKHSIAMCTFAATGAQYYLNNATASLHKLAAGRKLAATHLNVSNRQMCGCTGFKSGSYNKSYYDRPFKNDTSL